MSYFVGIDIGTSGTRALLIDETGKVVSGASSSYSSYTPQPGWSEQDAEDWWASTVKSVRQVLSSAEISSEDVKGIGLSGQMHGSVFLDSDNNVLRRPILWNDQRAFRECAEIIEFAGSREKLISWVSNPPFPGFTAPKILWFRKNEPQLYEQCSKILLPKDYIRFRMTGTYATDLSDASGMLLVDVARRKWSKELLNALDIPIEILPELFESEDITGTLTDKAADELGLTTDTFVVAGAGDQAAGAIGTGVVKDGVVTSTIGTSGVLFAYSEYLPDDNEARLHNFCHAVKGKWHSMGAVLCAGGSLSWYCDNLAHSEIEAAKKQGRDVYELLSELADTAPTASEGLFFLPYLTGDRIPHDDPHARGCWIGITPRHSREHLIRSIMEGVVYGLRDSFEIMLDSGIKISEIRLCGGGARSPLWRQIQADIYGQPVYTLNIEEGPAFGVALLAAVAGGAFDTIGQACDSAIKITGQTDPNPANVAVYNIYYPVFGDLYKSLKDNFRKIAEVIDND
ncbi:MAG: xylulokinase [Bacteroidetes bacterium]|nr:MAG: xylulokinase [Bacteroidota bacterium]